jgi:formyltetrahydrofolate deformylase
LPRHVLTLTCADQPGIVAAVTARLFESGANIVQAQQFDDAVTSRFFMRVVFTTDAALTDVHLALAPVADRLGMTWRVASLDQPQRVLLMVSKFDHCLGDLLYRHRIGELPMEIVGIIGNHPASALATPIPADIPYHHLPITPDTKEQQEAQVRTLVERAGADLVVLARYMQILSDDLARFLEGRCINIHHSFLPGFKGAKPYHQAYDRGVKVIGATAHYVTADLDEGPIIVQDVEHITHADAPDDLIRKGRDIERRVLARAVRHHIEHRVIVAGNKTVVFVD